MANKRIELENYWAVKPEPISENRKPVSLKHPLEETREEIPLRRKKKHTKKRKTKKRK